MKKALAYRVVWTYMSDYYKRKRTIIKLLRSKGAAERARMGRRGHWDVDKNYPVTKVITPLYED